MSGERKPTRDESELFERTVRAERKAKPASARPRRPVPPPAPTRPSPSETKPAPAPATVPSVVVESRKSPVPGLDRRSAERLAQGRFEIEARLDLHGRRVEEAHQALGHFVLASQAAGKRCVLVITGKGGAGRETDSVMGEDAPGVLKRELPSWLATAPLAGKVLAARPALPRDGGEGAFYLLLRRKR